MTQDDDARGAGLALFRQEPASELGLHAERREEVRSPNDLIDAHRLAAHAALDERALPHVAGDLLERSRLRAVVDELRPRERELREVVAALRQIPSPDRDDAVRAR